jgi:hypothetical protein
MGYSVQSPVLFLNFNRPSLSLQVFEAIMKVKPRHLYFAVDGPRENKPEDISRCNQTKQILHRIDWDCAVHTLFSEKNAGCKAAVSTAISWFFEHEEEGIILEDDCLPAESFFYFCDQMLKKYRTDARMFSITGTNLQDGKKWGEASYYFSQYSNIWGWATWRRVWKKYDVRLERYDETHAAQQLANIFTDRFLINEWIKIFQTVKAGGLDTWDYQFNFLTFFENGLCITPNVNLVSNIGFDESPTHRNNNRHYANLPLSELTLIVHPNYFLPQKAADYYFQEKEFYLKEKWTKFYKDRHLRRRIKRWIRNLFTKNSKKIS